MPEILISLTPSQALALSVLSPGDTAGFAARQVTAIADQMVKQLQLTEISYRLSAGLSPPASQMEALLHAIAYGRLPLTQIASNGVPPLETVRQAMRSMLSAQYHAKRQAPVEIKGARWHADDAAVVALSGALATLGPREARDWFDLDGAEHPLTRADILAILKAVETRRQALYVAKRAHQARVETIATADDLVVAVFDWPEA